MLDRDLLEELAYQIAELEARMSEFERISSDEVDASPVAQSRRLISESRELLSRTDAIVDGIRL